MRLLFTYLFLTLGITLSAQVTDRGGRGNDVRKEVAGEKRALIVGISDYAYDKLDLEVADDDARLFKNYLSKIEKVADENIIYLENEKANAQAIYQGIDELIKVTQEGDEVYIYFAGHGDVVNRENEKIGFLLAHDVNEGRNYRGTDGVIALAYLNDFVNQLTTAGANVVMALDACHSGFIYEEGAKTNMNTLSDGDNFVKTTKFLSCAPSQTSQEDAQLGHGYFTFYWVLGMMGAADIGAQDNKLKYSELDDFVYDEVANVTDFQQEPLVITSNRRRLFKSLVPETKELALLAHGKSINLKDTLRGLRSSESNLETKTLSQLEKNFRKLIEDWEDPKNQDAAIDLFKKSLEDKNVEGKLVSRMRFTLSRKLTSEANRLINLYISGPKYIPRGSVFLRESNQVRKAMSLLDNDHPSYRALNVSALFLEAYSFIREDDYQNYPYAEKLLKDAVSIEPRAAYVWNALGILANNNHLFDDAQSYYQKAIDLIPTWTYPVNNLGTSYFDQYRFKQANDLFLRALSIDSTYNTARQNIGAVKSRMGYASKAELIYRDLLKNDADNSTLYTNLASNLKEKGNIKSADSIYKVAIKNFPRDIDVLDEYSGFLLNYNISEIEPELLLLKALELQPRYAATLSTYANFLRQRKYTEQNAITADSLYRTAIKINPFYTASYEGLAYLKNKQGDVEAVEYLEQAIKANPQSLDAVYNLAWFKRYTLEDLDEAISLHKRIIERNPYYSRSYRELSSIYKEKGDVQKAIELLRENVKQVGKNPSNLLILADNLHISGEKDIALQTYKECLKLDENQTYALANLAFAYIERGEPELALPYARKAIAQNPLKYNSALFTSSLSRKARKLKRQKKNTEALEMFQLAYQFDASALKPAFDLANELYLQEKSQKSLEILYSTNVTEESWIKKFKILEIKVAFDNNDSDRATALLNQLKKMSNTVDPTLNVLVVSMKDRKKAKELVRNLGQGYLTINRLKRAYSPAAIKQLTLLK